MALSIASDLVEVTGENRVLLHHGLKTVSQQARPGIRALLQIVHCTPDLPDRPRHHLRISPRINAAGRMARATEAVDLLTARNEQRAAELATNLDRLNNIRRSYDEQVTAAAIQQLSERPEFQHINIVWGKDWHRGVIGIVATRLLEHRYRPSVVISDDNGVLVGSARSTPGIGHPCPHPGMQGAPHAIRRARDGRRHHRSKTDSGPGLRPGARRRRGAGIGVGEPAGTPAL